MYPWERRLKDLSLLLFSCHRNYFLPEVFRLNINQFLQTSRTVTFILQKNKEDFSDFEEWYNPIRNQWENNSVLTWAKDSRNTIEKIGDLEIYSKVSISIVSSYLEEQDEVIQIENEEYLKLTIEKIHKLLCSKYSYLPKNQWALKIERKWIANTLPDKELLWAINYIYSQQYNVCKIANNSLKEQISSDIPKPSEMDELSMHTRRRKYLDSRGPRYYALSLQSITSDKKDVQRYNSILNKWNTLDNVSSLEEYVTSLAENAKSIFEKDGYHIPIFFALNSEFKIIEFISPNFENRVSKYIFWREIAERLSYQNVSYVLFIAEMWHRELPEKLSIETSIDKMKITGELLQVMGMSKNGDCYSKAYNILRNQKHIVLDPVVDNQNTEMPTFFIPIHKVISDEYKKKES